MRFAATASLICLALMACLFTSCGGNSGSNLSPTPSGTKGHAFEMDAPYALATGGGDPLSLAIADFNHDGHQDIVVANTATPVSVSVLLGKGDGTFQSPILTPISNAVSLTSIVAGDFNHDGNMDVIVGVSSSYSAGPVLTLLLGKGDGTFHPSGTLPGSIWFGSTLIAADLNGDGNLDLIASGWQAGPGQYSGTAVFLGNGDGTFSTPEELPSTSTLNSCGGAVYADFNNDGKVDLVSLCDGLEFWAAISDTSFSNGAFTPIQNTTNSLAQSGGGEPLHADSADFNQTGRRDLLVSYANGPCLLPGNGDGTFQANNQVCFQSLGPAIAADMNQDGRPDIVSLGFDQSDVLAVFLNDGENFSSTATAPYTLSLSSLGTAVNAHMLAAADFNEDGRPDIVAFGYGTAVGVFLSK